MRHPRVTIEREELKVKSEELEVDGGMSLVIRHLQKTEDN